MNVDFLSDYIILVAFGVCVCIGFLLKQWSAIPNNIINMWVNDWSLTPEILLGGLASGIAASGAYEYIKRFISKDNSEGKEA